MTHSCHRFVSGFEIIPYFFASDTFSDEKQTVFSFNLPDETLLYLKYDYTLFDIINVYDSFFTADQHFLVILWLGQYQHWNNNTYNKEGYAQNRKHQVKDNQDVNML